MVAEDILVYDVQRHQIQRIVIPKVEFDNTQRMKNECFGSWAICGNILYLFPWRVPGILRINLNTYEMSWICDWINAYEKYISDVRLTYFRKDVWVDGKYAYLVTWNAPIVFKFDMEKGTYEFIEIDNLKVGISTLCRHDEDLFLSDKNGKIFTSDKNFSSIEALQTDGENYIYQHSFSLNKRVWLVGAMKTVLASIDVCSKKISYIKIGEGDDVRICCAKPLNSYEIIIELDNGKIYIYNTKEMCFKLIHWNETDVIVQYWDKLQENYANEIYNENMFALDLKSYLYILEHMKGTEVQDKESINFGIHIYNKLKEESK